MTDSFTNGLRDETERLVDVVREAMPRILESVDQRVALPQGADAALADVDEPLPEAGVGFDAAIERLLDLNAGAGANLCGPRGLHFVVGGSTPASMAADLVASAFEAVAYTWVTSPVGVTLELQALEWLKQLLGLHDRMRGVMVTGATMANFVGLASARQWWGEQQGFDPSETGLAAQPPLSVLTSGHLHASSRKVLSLLGIGRRNIHAFSADDRGSLDVAAFRAALQSLEGRPAIVIVNAGEVNAGEFDPVAEMIELAHAHDCWAHVDGAFGLFAALSPRTAHLVEGVEHADSVTVDGHKWLNVPYDSGYAFVRDHGLMARAFRYDAAYLPGEDDPRPTLGAIGPESSRRARGFAVWATLKAYGRDGHRRIVEHCLDRAQQLAERVDDSDDFERLADVPLNIVAFRFNPGGLDEEALNGLNRELGEAVLADGRFQIGTTRLGRRVAFRPAFSNWRTRPADVDEILPVIRELAARHGSAGRA